jgi:hypothetical protein
VPSVPNYCEECEGEGYVRGVDPLAPGALVLLPCLACAGRGIMAKQSPTFKDFNPTNDPRVAKIKHSVDELIKMVRTMTGTSGPESKRRASIAVTNFEQGAMWAVKALFSEDAVEGDDGGSDAA